MKPVHVEVDTTVCALSGYCAEIAGEVFELRDDGVVVADTPAADPELLAKLLEAESLCPTGAIQVRRTGT
jgi:ferredoxin